MILASAGHAASRPAFSSQYWGLATTATKILQAGERALTIIATDIPATLVGQAITPTTSSSSTSTGPEAGSPS